MVVNSVESHGKILMLCLKANEALLEIVMLKLEIFILRFELVLFLLEFLTFIVNATLVLLDPC